MDKSEILSKLITNAMNPDDEIAARKLVEELDNFKEELKSAGPLLERLISTFESEVTKSEDKAELCVRLAELSLLDTSEFRSCLHAAVKRLLPPYLRGGDVARAIGAKDTSTSVRDAALRLRKLQHIRSTAITYQSDRHAWGKVHGIDNVTGTIAVSSLKTGAVSSVPISAALFSMHFFNMTNAMMNLVTAVKVTRSSAEYRKILTECSLSELYPQKIHDILAYTLVPDSFTLEQFESWWNSDTAKSSGGTERHFRDSRSILELYTLLQLDRKEETRTVQALLTDDSAEKLKIFFGRTRPSLTPADALKLAECIATIASANSDKEMLRDVFSVLRGKVSFFPAEIKNNLSKVGLSVWGVLSQKSLAELITVTQLIYSSEELSLLAVQLPLKCLSAMAAVLPADVLAGQIRQQTVLTADLLLWIFKNQKNLDDGIVALVNIMNCIAAVSLDDLPKEWGASQRELKKALFCEADKAASRKAKRDRFTDLACLVLDNADGDYTSLAIGLQRFRKFKVGEREMVILRLANRDTDLEDFVQTSSGREMFSLQQKQHDADATKYTSIRSFKKLEAELKDLIEHKIPENNDAYAAAKAMGDLRENAEFDAAKDRRKLLNSRRNELERQLETVQMLDFREVEIQDSAVIGSCVKLSSADTELEVFLLGVYDSNPEKGCYSYTTDMGKALLYKKIGEEVSLPGRTGTFVVKTVSRLPDAMAKSLANED